MGQGMASSQFFLYGRRNFTQTGWKKHSAQYPSPDPMEAMDLAGRSYVVTGANSGLGKEISSYLARKHGRVYMVCRNAKRAAEAKAEIIGNILAALSDTGVRHGGDVDVAHDERVERELDENLVVVLGDCR
jgi:hypothetical protein